MIILFITGLTLISIACLLYGFSITYILNHILIILFPGALIWVSINKYTSYQHPLRKKITKILSAWEKDTGKSISQLTFILNLSEHHIDISLSSNLEEHLSMKYGECYLNGYIKDTGEFFLTIAHPTNQLLDIAALWDEVCKTKIKFSTLCLCCAPNQLDSLGKKLENEWRFVTKVLLEAKRVSLMINHSILAQSMYYLNEFGTLPPALTVTPTNKITQLYHQLNKQLDIFIETLFSQRLELCNVAPVNIEQKRQLLYLPLEIVNLKNGLMSAAGNIISAGAPLQSIVFQLSQQSPKKQAFDYYTSLSRMTLPITVLAICSTLIYFSLEKRIATQLQHLTGPELVSYLQKIEGKNTNRPLARKQIAALQLSLMHQFPHDEVSLYRKLLSNKNTHLSLKIWTVHHITNHTLTDNQALFLTKHWPIENTVNLTLPLSQIAQIIPSEQIQNTCQIINYSDINSCANTLSKIHAYHKAEKQLTKIEKTLLPIYTIDSEYAIRQLSYLANNAKLIGEDALKTLSQLSRHLDTTLQNRANGIKSTIDLLQSENGQFIISQLLKLHQLNNVVESNKDAHLTMQLAYQSDDHPLQQLRLVTESLSTHNKHWLESIFAPVKEHLSTKATAYIHERWEEEIANKLAHILNQYPFNQDSSIQAPASDLYQLFGNDQLIDTFFNQYISAFVQEEDSLIVPKPLNLGVTIPKNMLLGLMYTKILQCAIDIKDNHLHAAWAVNIVEKTHPVSSVKLYTGSQSVMLQQRESQTVHWDSRQPIGIDISLESGEIINVAKDTEWGILALLESFTKEENTYTYHDSNQRWHIKFKLAPRHPINLLSDNIIAQIKEDLSTR